MTATSPTPRPRKRAKPADGLACTVCKVRPAADDATVCRGCLEAALERNGWMERGDGTRPAKPSGSLGRDVDVPVADAEPTIDPEIAAMRASAPPASVRALRSFMTARPRNEDGSGGQPWRVGFCDVYSGEQAADLWSRHAEHFEQWPPVTP